MQTNTSTGAIALYRELVMLDGGEGCTTSRRIAERFGRTHSNVLASIDRIIAAMNSQEFCFSGEMFREFHETDRRGRARRQFTISKDGFALLAMRFDGAAALAWQLRFIAAFNWLAEQMRERDENNRLIAQFDIKNRESIEAGSYHGAELRRRKTEIAALELEDAAIKAKVQATLAFDGNPSQVH